MHTIAITDSVTIRVIHTRVKVTGKIVKIARNINLRETKEKEKRKKKKKQLEQCGTRRQDSSSTINIKEEKWTPTGETSLPEKKEDDGKEEPTEDGISREEERKQRLVNVAFFIATTQWDTV